MARFLFCSFSSPGFLFPHIRIAERLCGRGHQIAFATDVGRSDILANRGLQRIARSNPDGPSFQIGLWSNPLEIALQYKHACRAVGEFRPDAIVSNELGVGALLAARACSLPLAVLGSLAYLWPSSGPQISEHARWRYRDALRLVNEACSKLALATFDPKPDHPLSGDLFLLRSAPLFEIHDAHLPKTVHYVGSYLGTIQSYDPALTEWISAQKSYGKRLVYLQFGRTFGRPSALKVLKSVLSSMNVAVVAAVERTDEPFGEVPEGFWVRPYVPEEIVIKECDAVISTASSTTTLGAIEAAAPGIVFPSGGETPDIAERCTRVGSAISLDSDTSHEHLCGCLERVLTSAQMKNSCIELREAFRKISSHAAEDLLERFVHTGTVPVRGAA